MMKIPTASETFTATSVIVVELLDIIRRHKKVAAIVIIGEIWVHGLVFQHLTELKNILELIPFVGKLLN